MLDLAEIHGVAEAVGPDGVVLVTGRFLRQLRYELLQAREAPARPPMLDHHLRGPRSGGGGQK